MKKGCKIDLSDILSDDLINMSLIFAIETSCDETAMALVQAEGKLINPKFKIIDYALLSQIAMHKEFGGVVPNIAKREHSKALPEMIKRFKSLPQFNQIDTIAVTSGPGLEPALWTGIQFAKKLGDEMDKKVFAADHIKGHLYSFLLSNPKRLKNMFPMIALVVSGGHTILFLLNNLSEIKKIGETRDDASGEAFDKGARLLGLPYPGGPELEKLAADGNPSSINFPRPMLNQKNFDFSFAGLKTALLYKIKNDQKANWKDINQKAILGEANNINIDYKADIAAGFQKAIIDCLVIKSFRAVEKFNCRSVVVSGGVSANKLLRYEFEKEAKKRKIRFIAPDFKWSTDNAVMIAVSAYIEMNQGVKRSLKAKGNLAIL